MLEPMDELLTSFGFSVSADPFVDRFRPRLNRNNNERCGWNRVAQGPEPVFFSFLYLSAAPFITLQLKTRRKRSLGILEGLLLRLVERLQPDECVLRRANDYYIPVLASEHSVGGLSGIVSLDHDPPLELRPGDAGWFEALGPELLFLSQSLLSLRGEDAWAFAERTKRTAKVHAFGYLFDGGWSQYSAAFQSELLHL